MAEEKLVQYKYSSVAIYNAYVAYFNNTGSVDDFINAVTPYVRYIRFIRFKGTVGFDVGALETDAITYLYTNFLMKKKLKNKFIHHAALIDYLGKIIYTSMVSSYRTADSEKFDFRFGCVQILSPFQSYLDVDYAMYTEQLLKQMRDKAISRIRYNSLYSECEYLVDCFFGFIEMSPRSVRLRFRLDKPLTEYLVNYCKVLCRWAIWDIEKYEYQQGFLKIR